MSRSAGSSPRSHSPIRDTYALPQRVVPVELFTTRSQSVMAEGSTNVKIKPFSGAPAEVEMWCTRCQVHFDLQPTAFPPGKDSVPKKLKFAFQCTEGAASEFMLVCCGPRFDKITTWENFVEIICARFNHGVDKEAEARIALDMLWMDLTVPTGLATYNDNFTKHSSRIPGFLDDENPNAALHAYTSRLPPVLKVEVMSKMVGLEDANYLTAMKLAALHFPYHHKKAVAARPPNVPASGGGVRHRAMGNQPPADRPFVPMAERTCYRCGRKGHLANACTDTEATWRFPKN